jgi:hypothetical protein
MSCWRRVSAGHPPPVQQPRAVPAHLRRSNSTSAPPAILCGDTPLEGRQALCSGSSVGGENFAEASGGDADAGRNFLACDAGLGGGDLGGELPGDSRGLAGAGRLVAVASYRRNLRRRFRLFRRNLGCGVADRRTCAGCSVAPVPVAADWRWARPDRDSTSTTRSSASAGQAATIRAPAVGSAAAMFAAIEARTRR